MNNSEYQLIKELKQAGYIYRDINHIFKQDELPIKAVDIILKWVRQMYNEHLGTGDHLVRSLISANEPFDPTVLIDIFENSDYNFSVKSGIAYTLSFAPTKDISEWIKRQLLVESPTLERYGFIEGLAMKGGFKDVGELKSFLKLIFDKYPTDVMFKLWRKYGTTEDLPFLEEKAESENTKISNNLKKVISAIRKKKIE